MARSAGNCEISAYEMTEKVAISSFIYFGCDLGKYRLPVKKQTKYRLILGELLISLYHRPRVLQGVSLIVVQKENEIAWNKSVLNSSFWVLNGGYAWTF